MKEKNQERGAAVVEYTDWFWILLCVTKLLGVTLLSITIALLVLWTFYSFGWPWHVSNVIQWLSVAVFAFVPALFCLWRFFTFKPKCSDKGRPTFILSKVVGLFMVLSLINVLFYADKHFVAELNVRQITAQTPLDRIGRIGVQQFHTDTKRGIGLAWRSSILRHHSGELFHCFAVVPIKGRANDYWGLHFTEKHKNSTNNEQMSRYWDEFVGKSRNIIADTYTERGKLFKRVTLDYDLGNYRAAIRNTFGKQAEKPFTVWEAETKRPASLTTHLLWQALFIGVMVLWSTFILVSKKIRHEDRVTPPSLRAWWYEQHMSNRLLLLSPLLLMIVYTIVVEIGGVRLAAADTESLIPWGAPVRQLLERGEWYRVILAPFFPYNYWYFCFFAWVYGTYLWHCELRKYPCFLFVVYWVTSVVTLICGIRQSDADEMVNIFFGGLLGVLGCHWGAAFIRMLKTSSKVRHRQTELSIFRMVRNFYSALFGKFPSTKYLTEIVLIMVVWSMYNQPLARHLPIFSASIVGFMLGSVHALFLLAQNKQSS